MIGAPSSYRARIRDSCDSDRNRTSTWSPSLSVVTSNPLAGVAQRSVTCPASKRNDAWPPTDETVRVVAGAGAADAVAVGLGVGSAVELGVAVGLGGGVAVAAGGGATVGELVGRVPACGTGVAASTPGGVVAALGDGVVVGLTVGPVGVAAGPAVDDGAACGDGENAPGGRGSVTCREARPTAHPDTPTASASVTIQATVSAHRGIRPRRVAAEVPSPVEGAVGS